MNHGHRARSSSRGPSPRLAADTWVPSGSRAYAGRRPRSRSPRTARRRSRSPSPQSVDGQGYRRRTRTPPRRLPVERDASLRQRAQFTGRRRSPIDMKHRGADASSRIKSPNRSPSSENTTVSRGTEASSLRAAEQHSHHAAAASGRSMAREARTPLSPEPRNPVQEKYRYSQVGNKPGRASPGAKGYLHTWSSSDTSRRSPPLVQSDRIAIVPPSSRNRPSAGELASDKIKDTAIPLQTRRSSLNPPRLTPTATGLSSVVEDQATMQETISRDLGIYGNPNQFRDHTGPQRRAQPPGSDYGSSAVSSHARGSNLSLSSAPTAPRGSNLRETWTESPSRRIAAPGGLHGPPHGPRGSSIQPVAAHEASRHPIHRQTSAAPSLQARTQRTGSYLADLPLVLPGGKPMASALDNTTERRLLQLEADRERLFGHVTDSQKARRLGIMDWDKLDRESSISALRSELADGHLQRISDGEGMPMGITF